ncbi:ABC transporter ATP-binding protein [Brucella thiophenivorans]|uniref:ABC transporter family protein n=1 Tax=Brucella thiophenivorans TaxID=571255 RepID=A0A256FEQ3_9HYPH|nr:sn-glycerol-3-phosphate ABC transporter ATP-binding protein UgpC [Brucella thiophenivorans]OYR13357.1 ABC transporter family protein [Brucella thiophenivorans]
MSGVQIKDLRKSYGSVNVIKDVTIDVLDGEFVTLVGPSGCGKSTLLRMIAGLESIQSGEIHIGDRVVNDLAPMHRDIAMVFQSYALYPHMTVEKNMGFSLKLKGMPKEEIDQAVGQAAKILGLEEYLTRFPRQLSGGQRQRVAMGRAIVRNPRVFLFDEPLSNLDAKLRVQMRAEIKELHQRLNTTTIYVTHDQVEAMTMADKIVVLRDGLIEQIGSPLDLYDNPVNMFVAGFLGSPAMNFLPAKVTNTGIVAEDGTLLAPLTAALTEGQSVIFGIRPEHISLGGEGVRARISVVEPTGADTMLVLHVGDAPITVTLHERVTLKTGEEVRISVRPGKGHIFDAASGARL